MHINFRQCMGILSKYGGTERLEERRRIIPKPNYAKVERHIKKKVKMNVSLTLFFFTYVHFYSMGSMGKGTGLYFFLNKNIFAFYCFHEIIFHFKRTFRKEIISAKRNSVWLQINQKINHLFCFFLNWFCGWFKESKVDFSVDIIEKRKIKRFTYCGFMGGILNIW